MISLIESSEFNYTSLCLNNPFGCRIISLFNTYAPTLPFVDYWVQIIDEQPVSLIARLEASFILRITDASDLDELSSFLRVSGADSIICDGNYDLDINLDKLKGPILVKNSKFVFDENKFNIVLNPPVKDVYNVISSCKSDNFNVPTYEAFALDAGHKLNKETIRILGLKNNDILTSCIMTLSESSDSAVLGALATLPQGRNSGYGSFLISYITNMLISENKAVYLHRAPNENIEFYNKLGFDLYGEWAEYYLKD